MGFVDIGYMRELAILPPLEEQERLLREAGVKSEGSFFVDRLPERQIQHGQNRTPGLTQAILQLNPTSRLVIACPAVLGGAYVPIFDVLVEVGRRGASIFDASTQTTIKWHPPAFSAFDFIRRALVHTRKGALQEARRKKFETGAVGGAKPVLFGDALIRAREIWADTSIPTAEAIRRIGVSSNTCYRQLKRRPKKTEKARTS